MYRLIISPVLLLLAFLLTDLQSLTMSNLENGVHLTDVPIDNNDPDDKIIDSKEGGGVTVKEAHFAEDA